MSEIKIVIADDHSLVRQGIASIVRELNQNLQLLGEVSNGMELLDFLDKNDELPDVILMDVNMPEMNGIECTHHIKDKYPEIQVLALSMMKQGLHIQKMLKAGASGYILKDAKKDELKEAIYSVHKGHPYFSTAVSEEVMRHLTRTSKGKDPDTTPLSPREKEVLQLIVKDLSNQDIADKLHISIRTVETHKQNLLRKTGTNSVAGLVVYALKNNLADL